MSAPSDFCTMLRSGRKLLSSIFHFINAVKKDIPFAHYLINAFLSRSTKKEPDNNGITATFDNLKKMADLYSQNAASYQNIPGGENLYAKNKLGEAVNHALIKYYGINEMEEKTLYEFRMVEKAENNFNNKV